jgi:hypothetical protein
MFNSASSRRNALMMSIGWWYVRRLIRQRGTAAVASYVAGEGVSFARRPHRRHPLRWLVLVGAVAAGGLFWWRKRQGGGDDWGEWEPVAPVAPVAPMPVDPDPTEPAPAGDPAPTPVTVVEPADLIPT